LLRYWRILRSLSWTILIQRIKCAGVPHKPVLRVGFLTLHFISKAPHRRVAHPLDFGSSKGADFDFPNIPFYPLRLQQTKVFLNAILNPAREFARLFRGEEFFAAWRAPIHLCILDYYRDLLVPRRKLLANFLHAVRTTNCAADVHKWHTLGL